MALTRRRACDAAVLMALICLRADAIAAAQSIVRVTPSIGTTQLYDSNLFSTPVNSQADFITRLTPAVEVQYGTPTWTLAAREAIDLERFASRADLNRAIAGQRSLAEAEFRPSSRLILAVSADYSRSQNPADLSVGTGLTFARAMAERAGVKAAFTRHLGPLTTTHVEYTSTHERLAHSAESRTDAGTFGVMRHLSSRSTMRAEYRLRGFWFDDSRVIAQGVGVGVSRNLSPHTTLSIDGGPMLSSGTLAFEGALAMRSRFKSVDLEVAYGRTQTTVFGVTSLVAAQSVAATTTWRARRTLALTIAPAYYKSERGALNADVYRCAIGGVQTITRTVSVGLSYEAARQRGNLYAASATESIGRNQLMVRFTVMPTAARRQ
jgi:hypothetical protein